MLTIFNVFEKIQAFCTFYGGGKGGGTQTSTTINYSPEEAAERARVMREGRTIYDQTKGNVTGASYPGAVPTGPTAATQQGWGQIFDAMPAIGGIADAAGGAVARGMSPDMLFAESNPYLQSYMAAAIRPIQDQFLDAGGIMSGIRTDAQGVGGQGTSSRQGIAEGLAASRANREIGDITAQMASEGYGQGLQHQRGMTAMAPGVQRMYTLPGELSSAVGAQQEGYNQAGEDYLARARMWDLEKDWGPLENYANIVYGGGSSQSTAMSQSPSSRSNPLMGAVGGGLAGYGMASALSMANPFLGMGAGALIGLLGS